jgi:hypothetical protein
LANRAHQSQQAQEQRQLFAQVGRQGALNFDDGGFHGGFHREATEFDPDVVSSP